MVLRWRIFGRNVHFAPGKIPIGARAPESVYSVAARETPKHHAKFGWPPVSDVAAVTKPRCETVEICWGVPNC